jgi:quercetin dioxygenase-like cupin family protein
MHTKVESLETVRGFCEQFDLDSEISTLESHKPWPQRLTSKMLLKTDDLRIVLIVMQAGARMDEHHSDGRISIQVLRGTIRIPVQDQVVDLTPGRLLALDRSIKHAVEAQEDSAFLLTIAWPTDEELIGLKHRGYGS